MALGCFVPFVLMLVGAATGSAVAGERGGLIGLVAGFLIGGGAMAIALWSFEKARDRN